jgi:20S proteasome alpha/beta subunit
MQFYPSATSEFQEEYPMTLQVCLIGANGFVMASDTLSAEFGPGIMTHTFTTEKIFFSSDWSAAWCASGHSSCHVVCQLLAARLRDKNTRDVDMEAVMTQLRNAVDEYKEELRTDEQKPTTRGRILLAVAANGQTRGHYFDLSVAQNTNRWGIGPNGRFEDKLYSGDCGNSAIFFAEEYYRSTATVEELVPLAAHVILMGSKRNSSFVSGLEIVVCRAGQCRKLTESELDPLKVFSSNLDKLISEKFKQV